MFVCLQFYYHDNVKNLNKSIQKKKIIYLGGLCLSNKLINLAILDNILIK